MKPQLGAVAELVNRAIGAVHEAATHAPGVVPTVVDLGCGDGELSQTLRAVFAPCYPIGVDRDPAYRLEWARRGVLGINGDFTDLIKRGLMPRGDVYVLAEVLESIAGPGALLTELASQPGARFVVASSHLTTAWCHFNRDGEWRWPMPEFARLFRLSGWSTFVEHRLVAGNEPDVTYQVVLAERDAS